SATFTSNIAVTATLAIISFLMIQLGGIRHNGFFGYFKGLVPHGIPMWLLPLMIPVEILGLFTKPFASGDTTFCKYDRRSYCDSCTDRIDIFYGDNFYCTCFSCICSFYLSFRNLSSTYSSLYFYNAYFLVYRNGSTSGTLIY
ncbi:MAG: F0F1 ATP synthase subunit A, partial [Ignavibacteriales bacterium]|nr:F0F1 ATP synthase subunit A [Ignavibacteriales bacterium]